MELSHIHLAVHMFSYWVVSGNHSESFILWQIVFKIYSSCFENSKRRIFNSVISYLMELVVNGPINQEHTLGRNIFWRSNLIILYLQFFSYIHTILKTDHFISSLAHASQLCILIWLSLVCLRVSKFQKQIDLFSFEPKTERNISALRIDP